MLRPLAFLTAAPRDSAHCTTKQATHQTAQMEIIFLLFSVHDCRYYAWIRRLFQTLKSYIYMEYRYIVYSGNVATPSTYITRLN